MHFKKMVAGVAVALVFAGAAQAQSLKEMATCKLTNTEANKTLYEGACKVKQSMSGDNTIFSVKMDRTEPFVFAGKSGSSDWMHGAEHVRFTDLPTGGIFKWSNFALVVAEEGASAAPPQNVGREYDRGCEDAKMGSYDRSKHSSAYEDGWQSCKKQAAAPAPSAEHRSKPWKRGCEDAKGGSYDRSRHSQDYEDGWQACKKQ